MTYKDNRRYHWQPCAHCGDEIWTSSWKRSHICAHCRRELGIAVSGRVNAGGYTALTVAPKQVMSFGKCKCGQDNQVLANGRCEDCRFYSISDVDPSLSARAQRASGGVNDWVRGMR